jgi:Gpi18-like mannosyltransferase
MKLTIITEHINKSFYNKKTWFVVIFLGLALKLALFPIKLGDYNIYLEPWINFIKTNGYFKSLKYDFYNYTPSYIYILVLIAKIGFNPLYSIKIVSIIFEYILAYFVGKIAFIKYRNNLVVLISLAIVPLVPSILLNGAFWGQCDSIYSAFVVGSIYYIIKNKQFLSIFLLGVAFAFKIQSAFILPFYFVLLLRNKVSWYYFLLIPSIYVISILPTWFYGRSFIDLLTIYVNQSNYYTALTIYFPNLYIWISDDYFNPVQLIGLMGTILITLFSGFYLRQRKFILTDDILIRLAFLSVIISPFILPGMHERYLYLGDVMAVLYFIIFRKNLGYSLGIISISFYAYLCCSRLKDILPLWPAFFLYIYLIVLIIKDLLMILNGKSNQLNE